MTYRVKPEHNSANYLKAILESMVEYNAVARLDVSKLLYEGYKISVKDTTKHASDTLFLEILSKWMQVLEDFSVLCMMFENSYTPERQVEMYAYTSNQNILKFLHKVRKGLPKKAIMNIFGLKTAEEYYKAGKINKSEISHFRKTITGEIDSHIKTLGSIAKAYAGNKRRGKKTIQPSTLLDIYFKTKHGFKVIHPTDTAKKLWDFKEDEISMIDTIKNFKWGRKMLRLMQFLKLSEEHMPVLMKQVTDWSELQAKVAEIQLKNLGDPYWIVADVRLIRTQDLLKTQAKPGRNDDCLCESKMKFKKCCEPRLD